MRKLILKVARKIRELIYYKILKVQTSGVRIALLMDDKVLLIKHFCDDFWVFPGGGIKKRESPENAAIREVAEEVNYLISDLSSLKKIGVYNNDNNYRKDVVHFYTCFDNNFKKIKRRKSFIDRIEVEKQEWFPIDKLPKVSAATNKRLKEIKDKNYRANKVASW